MQNASQNEESRLWVEDRQLAITWPLRLLLDHKRPLPSGAGDGAGLWRAGPGVGGAGDVVVAAEFVAPGALGLAVGVGEGDVAAVGAEQALGHFDDASGVVEHDLVAVGVRHPGVGADVDLHRGLRLRLAGGGDGGGGCGDGGCADGHGGAGIGGEGGLGDGGNAEEREGQGKNDGGAES